MPNTWLLLVVDLCTGCWAIGLAREVLALRIYFSLYRLCSLAAHQTYARRSFRYEKKVQEYNFGSLIRTDAREEYGERNTIFGGYSMYSISLYLFWTSVNLVGGSRWIRMRKAKRSCQAWTARVLLDLFSRFLPRSYPRPSPPTFCSLFCLLLTTTNSYPHSILCH